MKRLLTMLLGLCLTCSTALAQPTESEGYDMTRDLRENEAVIYLAGGCFWGMEKLMSLIPGVEDATSGYANGTTENPTYREVCTGATGHRETVRVIYRPGEVSLAAILSVYFGAIDPTVKNRQGNDAGSQYQTGIYYADASDEAVILAAAETEKARHDSFFVEIAPLTRFYEAEAEHQDYLSKNPGGYCHIPAAAFERAKGVLVDPSDYEKPSDEALRALLTEEQYAVTQDSATEAPYTNAYWQTDEDGLYVDITTGEPLFASADKYDSSCGWPAFSRSIDENTLSFASDKSHGMVRTEVRSRVGNAHLGHVFENDGESPTGTRYCINSASLRFVPYDQMEAEGYAAYMPLVRPVAAEYHSVTPQQAKEWMDAGETLILVDVRTPEEYAQGHIPGAILLPVEEIGTEPPLALPNRDAKTLVYCRSGRRSEAAARSLVAMGYTGVYDLGGIIDWPYETTKD